jgi:hypothetical protein
MPIIAGAAINLGSGLYQTISGSQQQKKGQKDFEQAMAERPRYEISDTVKQQLAEAQARYNAQNPAIAMAYKQAQQGMANQIANAQRNAASGSQALAVGAGAEAQLQSIIPQLAAQQTAYNQQQYANLNQAQGLMSQEEKTRFSDMLAANQARQNFGLGLAQAGSAMKSQGLGAIAQGGLGLATAGLNGQFGGNKTNTSQVATVANPSEYYNNPMINPAAAPNTTGLNTNAFNLKNNSPLVFASSSFSGSPLSAPAMPAAASVQKNVFPGSVPLNTNISPSIAPQPNPYAPYDPYNMSDPFNKSYYGQGSNPNGSGAQDIRRGYISNPFLMNRMIGTLVEY